MTATFSSDAPSYASTNHPLLVTQKPLVQACGLVKRYGGQVVAVDHVDIEVYAGEVLGIVGESGSGKSTVLRLLNLEERPDEGRYYFNTPELEGLDLFALDRPAQRRVRTFEIGIVYQNPHLGLRMRNTSSGNIAERLIAAGERNYRALRLAARDALAASEFPLERMDDLPIRLSGGMQQRVQLAKAIALKPKLLLLDEPTTGLDVSVQARVLDTLKRLQRETGVTTIIVSHDLGVIRMLADRVMVMRRGHVVERGLTDQVLEDPQDAYTQQLVHAKL
ncbi:MAG: ABC transporter ATP-binding protein [Candidatus Roseilinea sp.]|nr:MAG: ABC transporter ATP-binding protein [Candidatus Roseilinea sp.]